MYETIAIIQRLLFLEKKNSQTEIHSLLFHLFLQGRRMRDSHEMLPISVNARSYPLFDISQRLASQSSRGQLHLYQSTGDAGNQLHELYSMNA